MAIREAHARTFEFWLGRAGSGKTHACLDAAASIVRDQPRGKPLLLLVPEQMSAQTEYALATRPGMTGFTRARVVSFRMIEQEVFRRVGGRPRAAADDESRVMLMRQVLRRRRSELRVLGRSADLPGLAEAVSDSLLEFQRYGWDHSAIERKISELELNEPQDRVLIWKLQDLASVWRGYTELLSERELEDLSAITSSAIESVRRWDELEECQIWIDGFTAFTGVELNLLEALLSHAESAAMSLTLDPADPAFKQKQGGGPLLSRRRIGAERTFETIEDTYLSVRRRIETMGWHLRELHFPLGDRPGRFAASRAMAHLERGLTRLRPEPMREDFEENGDWPSGPIELVEAENLRTEVEAAARRIAWMASGADRKRRYSETAVIVRSLEPYAPLVREIFPRYGIPYFLDSRRSISGHPVSRLLISALAMAADDWRAETVLDYLKTGLAPIGDAMTAAKIENLAADRKLSGPEEWLNPDRWHPPISEDELDEDAAPERDPEVDRLFEAFRRAIRPVRDLRSQLQAASPKAVNALWDFLVKVNAAESLEAWIEDARAAGDQETADIHLRCWEQVIAILERAHAVGLDELSQPAGSDESVIEQLREAIETGLATVEARLIPPTLDQVIVGTAERSRIPDVKAAFVLGLSEGQFPLTHEEDAMFGDREREQLVEGERELGPNTAERFSKERFYAYMALTRASEYLCVSYARTDAGGRSAGPSPVFRAVAEAFPLAPVEIIELAQELRDERAPLLAADWVRGVVQTLHRAARGEDPAPLGRVMLGRAPLEVVDLDSRAEAEASVSALAWPRSANLPPELAREFWLRESLLTVTALEQFALCPFRFFGSRMLRLERRAEAIPGPIELGQLRHYILEKLFERLKKNGAVVWGEIDAAKAHKIIDEAADEGAKIALAEYFGRDALTTAMVGFLVHEMHYFVDSLRVMGKRYGFAQVEAEFQFGSHDHSGLRLQVDDALAFTLRGSVDRIDRRLASGAALGDEFLLYDYKSGGKAFNGTRMFHGIDLQLPAYALALEASHGNRARVCGFFYWPLSIGIAAAEGEDWAEPGSVEWFRSHQPSGVFDLSIAGDLDREVGASQSALAFNFRRNKDGSIGKQQFGPVAGTALRRFLEHAREKMNEHAARIAAGEIAIRPWHDTTTACELCDLDAVCRIAGYEHPPYRSGEKVGAKEMFKQFEEDA